MKNTLLITIALLLSSIAVMGQDKTIRGQVVEENNAGLPGVYVIALGTSIGVTTNVDGFYEITVPKETDTLSFSYVGYDKEFIEISAKTEINIQLKENLTETGTIVIQGFASATTLARRRVENLQTTPESIVTMTSEEIENAGISGIPDFASTVPNVSFTSSQNIGTHNLTVRGITQLRNGEAPVAIVIDGVNIPNPSALDQEMFDIEQIELVKGPQGALYGRNAIGGALNITTKRPTNTFSNFIKLGYSNGNTRYAIFGSSGAIAKDKLLYRIAASTKSSEGLIENTYLNTNVDFYDNQSLRAELIYTISDNVSADIIANYTDTKGGAAYYSIGNGDFLSSLGANNGITEPVTAETKHLAPIADELGEGTRTLADVSFRLNAALPFARLTSTTAITQIDYDFHGDLDFSPLRELFQDQKLKSKGINQEIRLTSNTDNKITWLLGFNYQVAEREVKTLGTLSSAGIFAGFFGFPQTDLANEVIYTFLDAQESNTNSTLAFFGQIGFKLGKKTELSLGLRSDTDKREQINLVDNTKREHTFKQLQPKVNFSHQFSPRIFSFASYSRGYRSGGFNAPTVINYPELYEAEFTDNYEIGIKTSWLNNRIVANFSAFFIDFKNTQIFLLELGGGGQILVNLGRTQNTGAEADFKFRVTKNLDLYASTGIINPKIIENGNSVPDSLGVKDNYSPLVNLNTTNLALQYSISLNKTTKLILRGEYEHRGKLYWHPDNADVQPPTEFVNLRSYLRHRAKQEWQIGFFVKNLFNTDYTGEYFAVEYSGAAFGDLKWPGIPRSLGLNLMMKF